MFNHIFERTFPGYPADHAPWWAGWLPRPVRRRGLRRAIRLLSRPLALSPARHGWRLDGVSRFASRRARRILPAYLAALAFSLLVARFVVPQPGNTAPTGKSVAVNGLLVQNLFQAPSPNRSFWSMAIEAQLYIALPLLLLLGLRVGGLAMVAAVTIRSNRRDRQPARRPASQLRDPVSPELAALFAMGIMAAGIVGASKDQTGGRWHLLAFGAAAPVLLVISLQGSRWTLAHAISCG